MGRIIRFLGALGVLAFAAVVLRRLLAERAPSHALNGSAGKLGSLDQWPPVPKKAGSGHAEG